MQSYGGLAICFLDLNFLSSGRYAQQVVIGRVLDHADHTATARLVLYVMSTGICCTLVNVRCTWDAYELFQKSVRGYLGVDAVMM